MSDAAEVVDGRRARAERNRDAVIDAILSLLREGVDQPAAADIAERAGVSLRSVFRHFDDLESLHRAAVTRQAEEVWPRFEEEIPATGPVADRAAAVAAHLGPLYEEITPVRRAAERLRATSPAIDDGIRRLNRIQRDGLAQTFDPELAGRPPTERRDLLDALVLASSWPAWQRLRVDQDCSVARARRIVARTLEALLVS